MRHDALTSLVLIDQHVIRLLMRRVRKDAIVLKSLDNGICEVSW